MNDETKNKITELIIEESMNQLNANINASLDDFKTSVEARIDGIKTAAYADIKTLESYITVEKPLVVNLGTVEVPKKKLVHKSFQTIIKILSSTKRKEKNIMLVGGAGGGKTHLVGSIAEALKLQFYPMSVGLQTTKSDLLGFINANGIYMPSPIRLAYENGGVLLLDEFDAAHAGVITILNSLLANGHCSFPDKIVEKHKDFVCLCACNTYGKGGTMDYVGRNRLDAATLDRFIIVDVDYDENLEKTLTNHDDWTRIINKIRENIAKFGVKMIVSPRASMDGADLLDGGFSFEEVLEMCVFKGCDDDTKEKCMKGVSLRKSAKTATAEPVEETFNLDILVDFDKMEYSVNWVNLSPVLHKVLENNREIVFDEYSPLNHFRIRLGSSGRFNPYLDDYTLFLNCTTDGSLIDSSSYNRPSYIEAFIDDLMNMEHIYNRTEDKIRLSVIYNKKKISVNLNTGEYEETPVVRKRKAK